MKLVRMSIFRPLTFTMYVRDFTVNLMRKKCTDMGLTGKHHNSLKNCFVTFKVAQTSFNTFFKGPCYQKDWHYNTLSHNVTAMLWCHVKHQLLLNKMQSFLWRNRLPWQQESLEKTPYILALDAHIWKTNLLTPFFFFWHKSDQQAKVKLSARFKTTLWSRFRATLNF